MKFDDYTWGATAQKIEFSFEAKHGWMVIRIKKPGHRAFETVFSAVFDPLSQLKAWLESIANGLDMGMVAVDTEGKDHCWFFKRSGSDMIFGIACNMDGVCIADDSIEFICRVNCRHFLKSFYHSWCSYFYSSAYLRRHWETVTYGEALNELLHCNWQDHSLRLSWLQPEAIRGFFHYLYQVYKAPYQQEKVDRLHKIIMREDVHICHQPEYWPLPDNYEELIPYDRGVIIDSYMTAQINNADGTNPLLLRSQIVEDFIYKK